MTRDQELESLRLTVECLNEENKTIREACLCAERRAIERCAEVCYARAATEGYTLEERWACLQCTGDIRALLTETT